MEKKWKMNLIESEKWNGQNANEKVQMNNLRW